VLGYAAGSALQAGAIPFAALAPPVAKNLTHILPAELVDNAALFQVGCCRDPAAATAHVSAKMPSQVAMLAVIRTSAQWMAGAAGPAADTVAGVSAPLPSACCRQEQPPSQHMQCSAALHPAASSAAAWDDAVMTGSSAAMALSAVLWASTRWQQVLWAGIVSFLGAVHWGVAMSSSLTGPLATRIASESYIYSVLPCIPARRPRHGAGCGAILLSILLPACYLADYNRRNLGFPVWYMALRGPLRCWQPLACWLAATRHLHAELDRAKQISAQQKSGS